jgi:hypothetical protein
LAEFSKCDLTRKAGYLSIEVIYCAISSLSDDFEREEQHN